MRRIFVGFFLIGFQVIYCLNNLLLEVPYFLTKGVALKKYQEILDWVKTQELPLDTSKALKLPDHLAFISHNGLVQVLHTSDDHYCVVIMIQYLSGITGITMRVKGIFICDVPLTHKNLTKFPDRDARIDMLGEYQKPYEAAWAFTNLYVRKQYNDCLFEVHRQLN